MRTRGSVSLLTLGFGLVTVCAIVIGGMHLSERLQVKQRVEHWWVWGSVGRMPIPEFGQISLPLSEASSTVSGVIHYTNGHLRARGASSLPLQHMSLCVSGVTLCVEDPYWSDAYDVHLEALPPHTRSRVLLARIILCCEGGDDETAAYRYYHFEPGEPVDLTLPYHIEVASVGEGSTPHQRLAFKASLGPLTAGREQTAIPETHPDDEYWEDDEWRLYLEPPTEVAVAVGMDNAVAGVRYADVSVTCDGRQVADTTVSDHHGMWRLSTDAGHVLCDALITGRISRLPQWSQSPRSSGWGTARTASLDFGER